MASLIEELMDVLEQECIIYEDLYKVSDTKTQVIVKGDIEELQKITESEQNVIDKILVLEKRRQGIVDNIAVVLNQKANAMTIADIVRIMENQPEFQKPLSELHHRLREVVMKLQQVNAQNRDLLENALEMTEFNINILQTAGQAPETANYDKKSYSGDMLGVAYSQFDSKS
ncbi:MAG: flagellar protein FlgN [Lachnospiraceae bacterium]|nr:flagellar protein FlgN [Lachnospiraceae bacterium]